MTSWDYFVGFEREPVDLDAFLEGQGYDKIPNEGNNPNRSHRNFESREGGLIEITFFSTAPKVKKGEVPDWRRRGFNVTSELMIYTKDDDAADDALRLAEATVKKYNGVLYDSTSDEYFRSEEL